MSSVIHLLMAEARKQARLKLPYIGLVFIVIMAAMWPHLMQYYTDYSPDQPQTGYEFVANAMISISSSLIPIFAAIFAATLVAGETSHGVIRYVLIRPITRFSFLVAKFLTAFIYVGMMMTAAAIVVAIVGALAIGYGSQRDLMLGVQLTPWMFWREFLAGFAFALLPAFATAAFGLFLSVLFHNAGTAVGVAAALLVITEPIKHKIDLGEFVMKDWLWSTYYHSALNLVLRLAQGTADLWSVDNLWRPVVIPLAWIAAFATASLVIVLRRDWGQ